MYTVCPKRLVRILTKIKNPLTFCTKHQTQILLSLSHIHTQPHTHTLIFIPWYLYEIDAQNMVRTYEVNQLIRFDEIIWLHRKNRQIRYFFSGKTDFTSYVRIMFRATFLYNHANIHTHKYTHTHTHNKKHTHTYSHNTNTHTNTIAK